MAETRIKKGTQIKYFDLFLIPETVLTGKNIILLRVHFPKSTNVCVSVLFYRIKGNCSEWKLFEYDTKLIFSNFLICNHFFMCGYQINLSILGSYMQI